MVLRGCGQFIFTEQIKTAQSTGIDDHGKNKICPVGGDGMQGDL